MYNRVFPVRGRKPWRKKWKRRWISLFLALSLLIVALFNIARIERHKTSKTTGLVFDSVKTKIHQLAKGLKHVGGEGIGWPTLVGYPPWDSDSGGIPESCESFWGNGFRKSIPLFHLPDKMSRGNFESSHSNPTDSTADQIGDDGWFRCHLSQSLRTSICEGTSVVIHPSRIKMSYGGENIESVRKRDEFSEFPEYSPGAFQLVNKAFGQINVDDVQQRHLRIDFEEEEQESKRNRQKLNQQKLNRQKPLRKYVESTTVDEVMPRGLVRKHSWRDALINLRGISSVNCSKVLRGTTLLVTRYEYANVFHTVTDWYSTFVTTKVLKLTSRPHIIFIDGHAQGNLDEGWNTSFGEFSFIKHYSTSLCLEHAVMVPLGYNTPIFDSIATTEKSEFLNCQGITGPLHQLNSLDSTKRLQEFGEFFAKSYGIGLNNPYAVDEGVCLRGLRKNHHAKLDAVGESLCFGKIRGSKGASIPSGQFRVLLIRRENYVAHPRQEGGLQTRLSNEPQLWSEMESWAETINKNMTDFLLHASNVSQGNPSRKWFKSRKNRMEGANTYRVKLLNGLFAHMSLKEQIQMVYDADVIVGAHGAGMTHLVFSRPGTYVFEIVSSMYNRNHYQLMSKWKGLKYELHSIGGYEVDPKKVLQFLSDRVRDAFSP